MKKKYSNSKKATLNTILNLVIRIITLISAFVMKTVLIKRMGVEYTGISSVFTDLLSLFSFAELGIGTAIIYELYKPIEEKDFIKIAKLMNFYKRAYQYIGTGIFFVGVLIIPFLNQIVTDVPNISESIVVIYMLYLLNTVISYFLIYQSSLLTANQENYKVGLVQAITYIIRLGVGSGVIILYKNFIMYLILDILLTILQNIIIYYIASDRFIEIKKYKNEQLSREERKPLLANVGALALYQISNVVVNSTDSLIISSVLGTSLVTFYSNYKLIVKSVDSFAAQLTISITPTFGNLAVKNNSKQKDVFLVMNLFIFWITLVSSLMIYFLATPFIELWLGPSFVMGNLFLSSLVIDYILVNLVRPVATLRNANGIFVQGKYRPLIMTILNVLISLVLVNMIGLPGVVLGTVISRIVTQVWFDPFIVYKYIFKESVISYYKKYLLQAVILVISVTLISFCDHYLMSLLFEANLMIKMMIKAILVLVVTNIVFVSFYFKTKEFIVIKNKVKKILN